MTVTDPISDMLATIRNGLLLSKDYVCTPSSKLKLNVLKVLQEEGYIGTFKENKRRFWNRHRFTKNRNKTRTPRN